MNKPGLSASDLFPAFGQFAASIPLGGGAGGLAKQAATIGTKQAGVTGAMEGLQASQGGEFNAENVAIDALLAGGGELIPGAVRNAVSRSEQKASELVDQAVSARAGEIQNPLSQESQRAQSQQVTQNLAQQAEARTPNLQQAAGDIRPDLDVIEAAERIGVADDLTPGMVSRSDTYRDIEGAIRAVGANRISSQGNEAVLKVAQKADDLITELGGELDKSALSQSVKDQTQKTIGDLDVSVSDAYKKVDELVPQGQTVDVSDVYIELQGQAELLGGAKYLEPFEKRILTISQENPSYALIDKERRKIGAALMKKQGAYKDMDSGRLKRMYGMLTDAQGSNLSDEALEAWNVAKGLTSQRKQLEDQSVAMFGKDLSEAFMPKFGQSLMNIQRGDYGKLNKFLASMPDREMREKVMVSALNDVFTQGSRKEKQLNIPGFVDWYASIERQPRMMKIINDNLPSGADKRLKDLYTVTKSMRDANARVRGTGIAAETLKAQDKAEGMLSKVMSVGKNAVAAEIPSSAMGMPGVGAASIIAGNLARGSKEPASVAIDGMISSPEFKRMAVQLAKDNFEVTRATKAAESALKKTERFKKWFALLPKEEQVRILRGGLTAWLGDSTEGQEQYQ